MEVFQVLLKKLSALVWIPLGQTSTKPRPLTNVMQSLHRQLMMVQNLILALKAENVEACFF